MECKLKLFGKAKPLEENHSLEQIGRGQTISINTQRIFISSQLNEIYQNLSDIPSKIIKFEEKKANFMKQRTQRINRAG